MNILLKKQRLIRLLPVAAMLLLTAPARAQQPMDVSNTYNWGTSSWGVGTGANAFTVTGTYDARTGAGTDYFYDAGSNAEISGTTAPDFYNLTMDNGGANNLQVTNAAGINIYNTGAFTNAGATTVRSATTTGAIRFMSGATYSGLGTNAAYVNGYVTKVGNQAFSFPVGSQSTASARSLSLTSAPANATDAVSVAYWAGDVSGNLDPTGGAHARSQLSATPVGGSTLKSVSPIGFWDFVSTATGPVSISVSLPAQAGSGSYSTASDIRLVGYNTTTNVWEILGTGGASGTTEGSTLAGAVTNMSNYSAIGFGSVSQVPLPVKLLSFTAVAADCGAQLSWQTANEQAFSHFEVAHSTDGKTFSTIGRVESNHAAGGSKYGFDYPALTKGVHYFRLKMVEESGVFAYSNVASVSTDCGQAAVRVMPNPVTDLVTVTGLQGASSIAVIDAAGRLVARVQTTGSSGQVDMRAFAAGSYLIRIAAASGETTTVPVVKR